MSDGGSPYARLAGLNHNVRLILVIVLFAGLSESLGFGSALSAYLYKVTGKRNVNVGYLESAMGLTKLVTALPVGDLSDRYGRAPIGKVGSFAYTAAAVMTTICLVSNALSRRGSNDDGEGTADGSDDDGAASQMFALWAVALCLWGFGRGVVDGPVLALFADSVPTGDRARFYFYLFVVFWAGALAGPVSAVAIFKGQKDEWTYKELSTVLFVALAFKMVNAVLLCFLRDNAALGAEADHVAVPGNEEEAATAAAAAGQLQDDENPQQGGEQEGGASNGDTAVKDWNEPTLNALLLDDADAAENDEGGASRRRPGRRRRGGGQGSGGGEGGEEGPGKRMDRGRFIPHIVFLASLIAQLGAGMTVKFFPLYFMVDCGASPATVQAIYVGVPLAMLAGGALNGRLAGPEWGFGRVQTIVLFKGLGVAFLFLLVVLDRSFQSRPLYLLVPPFLLQTGLTDSTYPLEESILMDFVPQNRRGRWKSLESVAQFGWAGSAILGGYLIDRHDYAFTFVITASIQAVAVLVWLALLAVVPKEEMRAAGFEKEAASDAPAMPTTLESSGFDFDDDEQERAGSIRGVSMSQYGDTPTTPTRSADGNGGGSDDGHTSPFDTAVM